MVSRNAKALSAPARHPLHAEPPRVGDTLAALRQARALSLDELSRLAGVSKSMLSQIERAQANPTVAVVWRLANALGVPLADLLHQAPAPQAPAIALVPAHATPSLRSPDGLCELRILGPIELAGQFEWYALTVQPGGALQVQAGDVQQKLQAGETARYAVDCQHSIRNLGKSVATAWLVVVHPT